MIRNPPTPDDRARLGELARTLMSVAMWTGRHLDGHFLPMGLTPPGARALLQLDPDAPLPTRALAERMSCDPSNVTAFVDRLEESGLVVRRVAAHDRRIKTLVMTDKGRKLRERMLAIVAADTPSLLGLTPEEQSTLLRLLDKAWLACVSHNSAATSR
jgi:DNA-binding MarR family transcriptional regulator